jgi:hypothetical protein
MSNARPQGSATAAFVWRLLASLAVVALLAGAVLFGAGMVAGRPVAVAKSAVQADAAPATAVSLADSEAAALRVEADRSDADVWKGALPAIVVGCALLWLGCWTLAAERARSAEDPRRRA